jgi:hypothetical protein
VKIMNSDEIRDLYDWCEKLEGDAGLVVGVQRSKLLRLLYTAETLKNSFLFLSGFAMASPNIGPEQTLYYCDLAEMLGVTSPLMLAMRERARREIELKGPRL